MFKQIIAGWKGRISPEKVALPVAADSQDVILYMESFGHYCTFVASECL